MNLFARVNNNWRVSFKLHTQPAGVNIAQKSRNSPGALFLETINFNRSVKCNFDFTPAYHTSTEKLKYSPIKYTKAWFQ